LQRSRILRVRNLAMNGMGRSFERRVVEKMFARADIRIGGDRPFDIRVSDERLFRRILRDGQLGIGESYVDGWWNCDQIDEMTARFINAGMHRESLWNPKVALNHLRVRLSNIGSRAKVFEVAHRHYDLGNDLFRAMLDERMVYSCAYWRKATTLADAQEAKLDLICRKLELRPGMHVLDIGCGWGGWARFAAERYGVSVVGVTVSNQQGELAKKICAGFPVEIRVADYREITGRFDRVISIAMFEAVGHRYYRTFMQTAHRCLAEDGLFALHSIFGNQPIGAAEAPWLNRYIFPNGELPSLGQTLSAAEGLFTVEALHHLDGHYERTLAAWHDNFCANWETIKGAYDDRFYRMWTFYLQISRGIFLARLAHVWQIVFSKSRRKSPSVIGSFDVR
jgi:cyclopropane-fatty-acyl-phospholipid synthase